jgi:hypothetical protein
MPAATAPRSGPNRSCCLAIQAERRLPRTRRARKYLRLRNGRRRRKPAKHETRHTPQDVAFAPAPAPAQHHDPALKRVSGASDVLIQNVWIHPGSPGKNKGANVTVRSCLIEQNQEIGVFVEGSSVTIETTEVRSTQPNALGRPPAAIEVPRGSRGRRRPLRAKRERLRVATDALLLRRRLRESCDEKPAGRLSHEPRGEPVSSGCDMGSARCMLGPA